MVGMLGAYMMKFNAQNERPEDRRVSWLDNPHAEGLFHRLFKAQKNSGPDEE